jgi:hypothetical protein
MMVDPAIQISSFAHTNANVILNGVAKNIF